jgi:hypothetical protein
MTGDRISMTFAIRAAAGRMLASAAENGVAADG